MLNHLGERVYSSYGAWLRAVRAVNPNATIEGTKDIAQALVNGRPAIGEWFGDKGVIYKTEFCGACSRRGWTQCVCK